MSAPLKGDEENWGNVPQLRSLRVMVTVLTATLTIGVLAIVIILVIRILSEPGPAPAIPLEPIGAETISLPAGEAITATGASPAALSLVTRDKNGIERLRLFHPETGDAIDVIKIERE